jgi:carbon storage regulator CsrA
LTFFSLLTKFHFFKGLNLGGTAVAGAGSRRTGPFAFYKEGAVLILTRRKDEAIVIHNRFGAEIRLVVVDVHGKRVRLGIEAPADVSVIREEVSKKQPGVEEFARELAWI